MKALEWRLVNKFIYGGIKLRRKMKHMDYFVA